MKVAILGFGVVGSGTYEVITKNRDIIKKKSGVELDVKYIVDIRDFSHEKFADLFIKDIDVALNDPEITVVVEVIGGATIAYDFTKKALIAGKNVVTSNKELVAVHGSELLKIAEENNVKYLFEATVGGGLPLISPMINCLVANEINSICGIVNGTTNFILTKMINENISFEDALKLAQKLGYAEKDPTADVCGIDAQRKICILADIAQGKEVKPCEVFAQGINNLSLDDVKYAEKRGKVIKLLARMSVQENKTFVFVAPHFVDKKHMLASVEDVFNAVMINGDVVDDVLFYGRGAGKLATASAVVSDIVDCINHANDTNINWKYEGNYVSNIEEFKCKFFVKMKNTKEIPFDNIENLSCKGKQEVAFITSEISQKELQESLSNFENYSFIRVL